MAKQKTEQSNSMTKWLAIAVIAVLVIALVVIIVVFTQKIGRLNRNVNDFNAQVAALQSQLSEFQGDTSTLQGQLAQQKAANASLTGQLAEAKSQNDVLEGNIADLNNTISIQDTLIEKMKYPKHFSTVEELANWLQKDNTNTLYPSSTAVQRIQLAFILQIHAARDGYLLTVSLPAGGVLDYITDRAIVGDAIYEIRPWDDFVQRLFSVPVLPSYPITSESGQWKYR
jgi:hypothetical protein